MTRRLHVSLVLLTLLALNGCGDGGQQTSEQETVAMTPAPLIDRELFFGDPDPCVPDFTQYSNGFFSCLLKR